MARRNARASARKPRARRDPINRVAGAVSAYSSDELADLAATEHDGDQPAAAPKAESLGIFERIDQAFGLAGEAHAETSGGEADSGRAAVEGTAELSPELAALADEAASSPLAGDENVRRDPVAVSGDTPATIPPDQFVALLAPGVQAAANVACDALRVTRLEGDETAQLAGALANLASAYDVLGQLDPKSAAWLSLAAVSAGIVARRRRVVATEAAGQPGQ